MILSEFILVPLRLELISEMVVTRGDTDTCDWSDQLVIGRNARKHAPWGGSATKQT